GGRIKRVDRLAQLDHDVVGRVDDVADRALAGGQEAHLDPVRRRPDVHATHPPRDEPRAQVRIEYVDREALRGRPARFTHVGRWQLDAPAGDGGDLARQTHDRERVAP